MGVKIPASFEDSTGTVVRLTGELEFDVPATPGQVLTADDPAATASFAAGGSSAPIQTGASSPLGAVVPTGIGYLYIDKTNGGLYIAEGATNADWVGVGGLTDSSAFGVYADKSDNFLQLGDSSGGLAQVGGGRPFLKAGATGADASLRSIVGSSFGRVVSASDDGAGNPTLGIFGVDPVPQSSAIPAAAGGTVVDIQARAALNTLLAYLVTRGDIHA